MIGRGERGRIIDIDLVMVILIISTFTDVQEWASVVFLTYVESAWTGLYYICIYGDIWTSN